MLSGYLITDLLVAEYSRHRGIGLKMFWLRRARRLLPALFVMLFVTVGWATLFDRSPAERPALRPDPRGLLRTATGGSSSTTSPTSPSSARPRPLGHLWSLAIEEQFYLVWPLLVLLGFRFLHSKRAMMLVTLALAAGSAIEMGILFSLLPQNGDPTRVYDGHRHPGLRPADRGGPGPGPAPATGPSPRSPPNARRVLNGVGGLSLLGIFVMFWQHQPVRAVPLRGRHGPPGHPHRPAHRRHRPPRDRSCGRCWGGSRCAGWGSARTPSTCGTTRSSC